MPGCRVEGDLEGDQRWREGAQDPEGKDAWQSSQLGEAPQARCFAGELMGIGADQMGGVRMGWDGGPKCRPGGWEGGPCGQAKGAEKVEQAWPRGCCWWPLSQPASYSTDYTNRLKGSAGDPEISKPEETL